LANLLFSPVGVILNGYPAPLPYRTLFSRWNLFRNSSRTFLNTLYIFFGLNFSYEYFQQNTFRSAHRYAYNVHTATTPLTDKNIFYDNIITCDGKMRVIRNIPTVRYTHIITIIILFRGRYCVYESFIGPLQPMYRELL